MKIEEGKFYKTRDGRKVRIYAIDAARPNNVNGAVFDDAFGWLIQAWRQDGSVEKPGTDNNRDIIAEWTDAPDIRWERIPDYVNAFSVCRLYGLRFDEASIFDHVNHRGDDWAFPNWRDFIGQTFERPKG